MLGVPKKSSGRNKSVTFFAIAKNAPLLSAAYFGVTILNTDKSLLISVLSNSVE